MHFIFNEVRQFQHIGVTYGNRVVEWLAGTSVKELYFARLWQTGPAQKLLDVLFGGAVEHGGSYLEAQFLGCPAKVGLHDLPDVHTVRHTQRIQYDVHRSAIGQKWHICNREYPRDDAFVTVASGHFVACPYFALLGNTYSHKLIDARRQFITRVTREHFDFDNLTALPVRYPQRGIFDFTGFLTEDSSQELFFRRQFCLALWRDFTNKNILRAYFRSDVDDTALIQVAQSLFTDVRYIARDLLGSELGIACIDLVLLDVYRGEVVFTDDAFADKNGVLVVTALPAHEGNEDVLP